MPQKNVFLKNYLFTNFDSSYKDELRKEIEDKFNVLRKMFIEDTVACATIRAVQTLFTLNIATMSRPQRFNMALLRMFDEKSNLEEHIFLYIQKISLETDDKLLMNLFVIFFPFLRRNG